MNIKEVLMKRDNMTEEDADDLINDAKEQLAEYLIECNICDAEDICAEFFGLEPDYLYELM